MHGTGPAVACRFRPASIDAPPLSKYFGGEILSARRYGIPVSNRMLVSD